MNANSLELVKQIDNLKKGRYLTNIANSSSINMCTGVGVYPENHFHSLDFDKEISIILARDVFLVKLYLKRNWRWCVSLSSCIR